MLGGRRRWQVALILGRSPHGAAGPREVINPRLPRASHNRAPSSLERAPSVLSHLSVTSSTYHCCAAFGLYLTCTLLHMVVLNISKNCFCVCGYLTIHIQIRLQLEFYMIYRFFDRTSQIILPIF